jgi:hypothetical protein
VVESNHQGIVVLFFDFAAAAAVVVVYVMAHGKPCGSFLLDARLETRTVDGLTLTRTRR